MVAWKFEIIEVRALVFQIFYSWITEISSGVAQDIPEYRRKLSTIKAGIPRRKQTRVFG